VRKRSASPVQTFGDSGKERECCVYVGIVEGRGSLGEDTLGYYKIHLDGTPSVSFYLSLDSAILYYPATNKKKQREYKINS
jgi:hypothetical protein